MNDQTVCVSFCEVNAYQTIGELKISLIEADRLHISIFKVNCYDDI